MLKKLIAVSFGLLLSVCAMSSFAADVDVNKADQAALDGVKGLGPVKSKAILAERKKHGEFKDWADFETRVKGIGDKSAAKLSEAGLTVNGKPRAAAPAMKPAAAASAPAMSKPAPAVSASKAATSK